MIPIRRRRDPLALLLGALVQLYRLVLSPWLGHGCRHEPSCSAYALEALGRHGGWPGAWLTAARLSRCRPGGSHGFDPVPARLPDRASPWAPWRYAIWSPAKAMGAARGAAPAAGACPEEGRP